MGGTLCVAAITTWRSPHPGSWIVSHIMRAITRAAGLSRSVRRQAQQRAVRSFSTGSAPSTEKLIIFGAPAARGVQHTHTSI